MESSFISNKKSIIPCTRNPSLARDPDADTDDCHDDAVEAMKRLRQIETRSASLQVRGVTRPSANSKPEEDDPMTEMRRQRQAAKQRTATATWPSPPSPVDELWQERLNKKGSIVVPSTTNKNNNQKEEVSANDHTGSALSVKAFGRHASKVPPNTVPRPNDDDEVQGHIGAALPIKAFGRLASRVPPNTVPPPNTTNDDDVQGRTGSSLPVKSFCRKESKVPANNIVPSNSNNSCVQGHIGASLPVKAFGRHESKVPPNTNTNVATTTTTSTDNNDSIGFHTGSSLSVKAFGRHESKVPSSGNVVEAPRRSDRQSIVLGEQAAHRKRFSHRQGKTVQGSAAPPKGGLVKRFQSLQSLRLSSFRRKPSQAVGKE